MERRTLARVGAESLGGLALGATAARRMPDREDLQRARDTIKATICSFYHPIPHPYYDFLLREQGFARAADACAKYAAQGHMHAAMEQIDDAVADRLAVVGTPARIARRLTDYDGLVDEVIFLNVGGAGAASLCEAHGPVMAIRHAAD